MKNHQTTTVTRGQFGDPTSREKGSLCVGQLGASEWSEGVKEGKTDCLDPIQTNAYRRPCH